MTARTVWLASFPKSGNTWVRAILTALDVHRHLFAANRLSHGGQPYSVSGASEMLGIDPRWLDRPELDRLRASMIVRSGDADPDSVVDKNGVVGGASDVGLVPLFRKTHEVWRAGEPDGEPFPVRATRAAIFIVRDPRDVACSYAPFFGLDLDGAVEAMANERGNRRASPALLQTAQPWGTWTSHLRSWLSPDVPFPVHRVRYEDLKRDAVATLETVLAAIGMNVTREQLANAVHESRFERLRDMEHKDDFREVSPHTEVFFRKGQSGGWREELSPEQVAAIEADHGDAMEFMGYEPVTPFAERSALAEARASVRRSSARDWTSVPARLNLEVREGPIPDEIPDAVRPTNWLQTTRTATRVQFAGGAALMVEDGRVATVQWGDDTDDGDRSWLVQGWAVTLATLQRGGISLHASTVKIGDSVVAIAGHRGAGKSTTSMALRARGHALMVDDVTLVDLRDDGAFTTPFSRNVHLLPDAAEHLGVDFGALPMLAAGRTKAAFRPEDPDEVPHRLETIFVLQRRADLAEPVAVAMHGAQKLPVVMAHASRDGTARHILGERLFFDSVAKLADKVNVVVVRRPIEGMTLDRVVALIEEVAASASPRTASTHSTIG